MKLRLTAFGMDTGRFLSWPWEPGRVVTAALMAEPQTPPQPVAVHRDCLEWLGSEEPAYRTGIKVQDPERYLIQARVLWSSPLEHEILWHYVVKCALIEVKSIRILLLSSPDSPLWEPGQSLLFQASLTLIDEELSGDDFFLCPFDLCEVFTQYQFISSTGSDMVLSPVFKHLYMPYEYTASHIKTANHAALTPWPEVSEKYT